MSQDLIFSILPRAPAVNKKREMIKTPKMEKKHAAEEHADVQVQPKIKSPPHPDKKEQDDGEQHNVDLFV